MASAAARHEAPHEPAPAAAAAAAAAAAPPPPSAQAAYALADDGAARDPAAFRAALMADPDRMARLEGFPDFVEVLRAGDLGTMQGALRTAMAAEKARLERLAQRWPERTIDAQRASAPVPRDTVQVYKQLAEAGLEYGPAFRLLRNVHVPLP